METKLGLLNILGTPLEEARVFILVNGKWEDDSWLLYWLEAVEVDEANY